jgi:O-acetyl-ADP-ribose deacetylase (regulator of RNase III)
MQVREADITKLNVDAIVNAANEHLSPGGGVSGAIHRAAGKELAEACAAIGHCPTGEARITPGFRLPAEYVIHTVGPVWKGGRMAEDKKLASCYTACLELAKESGLHSVAFPAISTGIYGYPLEAATEIAIDSVAGWLRRHGEIDQVIFCCFGQQVVEAYESALAKL